MKSKIFNAGMFKSTEFSTAEDKAKFANHLIRFIESGYNWNLFYRWFYTRLSMSFGHIAHYNKSGFYNTWFADKTSQSAWLSHILSYGCYGQAEYTYCDAESAIQDYLRLIEIKSRGG